MILMNYQPKKRQDLQGWRAVAIIAVLFFHIWPKIFPNGFVGVDIFFVISGFLMNMLFATDDNKREFNIFSFYFRRLKRIVPIFAVFILLTLILLKIFVNHAEYPTIIKDARQSLFFLSNFYDYTEKLGYFEIRSSYRFFRHCWSLAVEMQFYLIFPLIVYLKKLINYKIYLSSLLVLSLISYFCQLMAKNEILKYELTLFRFWQFAIGILGHELSKIDLSIRRSFFLKNILFIKILLVIFLPFPISRAILSPLTLLLTSLIIILSSNDDNAESNISTSFIHFTISKLYLLIGNISYVLYLIHWPLITWVRHTHNAYIINFIGILYFSEGLIICLTSVILAIVIHHVVEKPLIAYCDAAYKLGILLILIYSSIFGFIAFEAETGSKTSNLTAKFFHEAENFSNPLILPSKWSQANDLEAADRIINDIMSFGNPLPCSKNEEIKINETYDSLHYCDMALNNTKANFTVLLVGNSFARNVIKALATNPAFKRIILIYGSACSFPYDGPTPSFHRFQCTQLTKIIKDAIVYFKPDILYLTQFLAPRVSNLELNNNSLIIWKETFQFLQDHTSAIIMNSGMIEFPFDVALEFSRRKFNNLPINNMKVKIPINSLNNMSTFFHDANCPKCFSFDYRDAFCKNEICDSIDSETHLPLFRDKVHISILGLRKLKTEIDKATEKALNLILSNKIF